MQATWRSRAGNMTPYARLRPARLGSVPTDREMTSVANPLEKLLRAGEGRILRRLNQVVKAVGALEEDISRLTDDELRNETVELRARYEKGETLDQLMP